jgi:predicted branched-subunit amino acid permease
LTRAVGTGVRAGFVDMLPFALGVGVLGVVFGAGALDLGIDRAFVVAMSVFVYSGSAQFAALTVWEQGAPVVVLTVLALSLRFALLTATIATWLGPASSRAERWRRAALAYLITDENFAAAAARPREQRTPAYLAASGITLAVAWVGGTLIGVAAGTSGALDAWADLTGPLFAMVFLALTVLTCTSLPKAFVAVIGAILGVVGVLLLPPGWHILFAGLLASAIGPFVERLMGRHDRSDADRAPAPDRTATAPEPRT